MKWKGRRQSENVEIAQPSVVDIIHQQAEQEFRETFGGDPDNFKRIPGIPVPSPNPRRVNVTPGGIKEKKDRLKKNP